MGLLPQSAPNRLLEEQWVEQKEVTAYLETVAPGDLASQISPEPGQGEPIRWARLWSSCPELWAEAHGRPDMATLAIASRRRVLELERVAEVAGHGNRARLALLRFEDEIIQRGEPWFELFFSRARAELVRIDPAERAKLREARAQASVRRGLTTALSSIASHASAKPFPKQALLGLAALTIPGVSLTDAREVLYPEALRPGEWAKTILELAGVDAGATAPHGAVRLVPTEDCSCFTLARGRERMQWLAQEEKAGRLLEKPGTRVLWRPEIQQDVAAVIAKWLDAHAPGEVERLRRAFKLLHDAIRKRYRQTIDPHYERAALPLRLLAAGSEEQQRHAAARTYGVILAARAQGDPAGEAQIHRWLWPYQSCLPCDVKLRLTHYRAEFTLVTTAVTFATLWGRKRWRDRHERTRLVAVAVRGLRAIRRWVKGGVDDARCLGVDARKLGREPARWDDIQRQLERLARLEQWMRGRIREEWHSRRIEQGSTKAKPPTNPDSSALLEMVHVVDEPALPMQEAVEGALDGDVEPLRCLLQVVKDRRQGKHHADPFACILAAQAAISKVTSSVWLPDSHPTAVAAALDGDLRTLADDLLKEALLGLERPLPSRSYLMVRLLLAFDLRVAQGRGPDMTFFGPVRDMIAREGGEQAHDLLRGALRDVAHRELLAREPGKPNETDRWREVAYLARTWRQTLL